MRSVGHIRRAMATPIHISPEMRERLARLKTSPRDTCEDVLNRLLALVPEGDEEGPYTQAFRASLLEARLDIKEGRLVGHEDVKRRLGR